MSRASNGRWGCRCTGTGLGARGGDPLPQRRGHTDAATGVLAGWHGPRAAWPWQKCLSAITGNRQCMSVVWVVVSATRLAFARRCGRWLLGPRHESTLRSRVVPRMATLRVDHATRPLLRFGGLKSKVEGRKSEVDGRFILPSRDHRVGADRRVEQAANSPRSRLMGEQRSTGSESLGHCRSVPPGRLEAEMRRMPPERPTAFHSTMKGSSDH